jgi:hypothetical protein
MLAPSLSLSLDGIRASSEPYGFIGLVVVANLMQLLLKFDMLLGIV